MGYRVPCSGSYGSANLTIGIPQNATIGTVITNNANISTSSPAYNETQTYTNVTQSPLPQNVTVAPNNRGINGIAGTLSVNSIDPITFTYQSSDSVTGVDIGIQLDDGGSPIVENMIEGPSDYWTYNTTFSARTGNATVTYTVHESTGENNVTFNIYVDPAGYIYDVNTGKRIAGAYVWLQRPNSTAWENVPTGESIAIPDQNPEITNADGQYQWDVIPGTYRVHVEDAGYKLADSIVVAVPPPVEDLNVGLVPLTPALNITKSATTNNPADSTTYNTVGQQIAYTYNVTNTGTEYVYPPINVTDNQINGGVPFTIRSSGLAPGQSVPGKATYTITQQDVDNGSVTNLANATGSYNGAPVISHHVNLTVTGSLCICPAICCPKSHCCCSPCCNVVEQNIKNTYNANNAGDLQIKTNINSRTPSASSEQTLIEPN